MRRDFVRMPLDFGRACMGSGRLSIAVMGNHDVTVPFTPGPRGRGAQEGAGSSRERSQGRLNGGPGVSRSA